MRAKNAAGLTPQQIAGKYSLTQVPTMVTGVTVLAGTPLSASVAGAIPHREAEGIYTGGNGGGGVQFQINLKSLPHSKNEFDSWFTNGRPIK